MNSQNLPNSQRNIETSLSIATLKSNLGLGPQTEKHASIAQSTALLNVAESIQYLQLQIVETSREDRANSEKQTDKLIESNRKLAESNEKHSNRLVWFTGALVIVGLLQMIVTLVKY